MLIVLVVIVQIKIYVYYIMENIQAKWEKKREGVWKGYIRILDTEVKEEEKEEVPVIKEESRCSIS